jgi:hypothetical protein
VPSASNSGICPSCGRVGNLLDYGVDAPVVFFGCEDHRFAWALQRRLFVSRPRVIDYDLWERNVVLIAESALIPVFYPIETLLGPIEN